MFVYTTYVIITTTLVHYANIKLVYTRNYNFFLNYKRNCTNCTIYIKTRTQIVYTTFNKVVIIIFLGDVKQNIAHLSCMLNKSVPPTRNTFFTARAPLQTAMTAKWPPTSPSGSGHTRMASALTTTSDARAWACRSLAVCRHAARTAGSGGRQKANTATAVRAAVRIVEDRRDRPYLSRSVPITTLGSS